MEGAGEGSAKDRLVVVGGGIAGAFLAKSMQSVADVVLIDSRQIGVILGVLFVLNKVFTKLLALPGYRFIEYLAASKNVFGIGGFTRMKDYFEIPWAELRSMVEPSLTRRSLISHTDYTSARVIVSSATHITENQVFTADGGSFTFDYLVVATGHAYSTPRGRDDRIKEFQVDNEKIRSSKSVLIIGGGPTGVELAGEIAVDYPEKKVTLVHKGSRLMEFIGSKASKKALDWLTLRKVEVLLEQSVDLNAISEADGVYTTSSGEKIAADCHFVCIGKPLGSSWLHESMLKDSLDKKGRLMVDEYLRVKGQRNVFAVGDITDVPEIKQGYLAQRHAEVVAKNLKLLMKEGATEKKLAKYKAAYSMALVSLGRKEAVAQLPFVTISGCFPGLIKSRDLFVGKTRKSLGLAP